MANRTKSPANKMTAQILIRVSPALKAEVDAMCAATETSASEYCRRALSAQVERWQATQKAPARLSEQGGTQDA